MLRRNKYAVLKRWLASWCLLCIINACHKGTIEPMPPNGEEVTLTFSAKLPSGSQGLKTYALSEDNEKLLSEVDVLVFADDGSGNMRFRYRSVGKDITPGTGNSADIKVTLWRTVVDTRLVVIANGRDVVNAFNFKTGITTPGDIQQELIYEINSADGKWPTDGGDFTPLPMWGQSDDIAGGINGEAVCDVTLLRSLARVDVTVHEDVDDFELTEVWVFNSKSTGLIVPDPDNLAGGVAQIPSLPIGGPINNNDPLGYHTAGENSVREIYLFEADVKPINDNEATALVVGGIYDEDDDPTYFRIDFRDPNTPSSLYPVLRNHRYLITITKVFDVSTGFPNPIDAFGGPSITPSAFIGIHEPLIGLRPSMSRTGNISEDTSSIKYTIVAVDESQ